MKEVQMFIDGISKKERGFELVSKEQFTKDFEGLDIKYEDIKLPKRSTAKSAGYDCFTPIDITLEPNEEIKLPTGIRSYMLEDEVLFALPRSGHGFKYYLRLANTEGVIDSDYYESDNEGHIFVKLRNEGNKTLKIEKGQGMCQLIFQKYLLADGDDFTGKQRNGGFGSTDKK
jgi:dUTP pyrophosphatase